MKKTQSNNGWFFLKPDKRITISRLNIELENLQKLEKIIRSLDINELPPEVAGQILVIISVLDQIRK